MGEPNLPLQSRINQIIQTLQWALAAKRSLKAVHRRIALGRSLWARIRGSLSLLDQSFSDRCQTAKCARSLMCPKATFAFACQALR
jgi:hypothetical protein